MYLSPACQDTDRGVVGCDTPRIISDMDWKERAKKRMKELGITQDELTGPLGVRTRGAVGHYLSGRRSPDMEQILALAKALDCSVEWLLEGEKGGLRPPEAKKDSAQGMARAIPPANNQVKPEPEKVVIWGFEDEPDSEEFAFVSRYEIHVSAGNGNSVFEELELEQPQAFRREWIQRKGLNTENLACIYASGDSMEPTLGHGDVVLIDRSQTEVIDGKVYVIRYGDEVRIKRLYKRPDGGLIIFSDNESKYPSVSLRGDELEGVSVLGRAVWVGSEL